MTSDREHFNNILSWIESFIESSLLKNRKESRRNNFALRDEDDDKLGVANQLLRLLRKRLTDNTV